MKKRRIFVSLGVPEKVKEAAEKKLGELGKLPFVKTTPKKNIHVTVVFCGYLDEEELEKLKTAAEKIARETEKFKLIPEKIAFAPPRGKNKSMVWLAFKRSPEFSALSGKFAPFADRNMKETFPHITLARFKDFRYPEVKNLLPEEGACFKGEEGAFEADSLKVMESAPSPDGVRYGPLAEYGMI